MHYRLVGGSTGPYVACFSWVDKKKSLPLKRPSWSKILEPKFCLTVIKMFLSKIDYVKIIFDRCSALKNFYCVKNLEGVIFPQKIEVQKILI